ncbi:hypothetical protein FRC09_003379 [Ceratobasidium sp. 395]|nr:hypothetical protein FRC09_003379 [Ceratobasidium sp. 395]
MPSFFIEMPTTPLSRHNNNTTRSARPSLSRTEIEAPTKSAPKSKNVADTQNIKPDPNASNNVVKRKRSASDMVSGGVLNAKKPRGSGLEKSGDKTASRSTKHIEVSDAVQTPKWIPISTAVSYDEVMERMQLREFLARFQPLTKFAYTHLDTLSRLSVPTHRYLPRATLKAVLFALLDLLGADASPTLRRECQTTIKQVRAAKGDLNIIWDSLAELRRTSYSELPDPVALPDDADYDLSERSDDEDGSTGRVTRQTSKLARTSQPAMPPKDTSLDFELVCGAQFLPILVFLAEVALQNPSVRSDIDIGLRTLATAAHKSHVAKTAEEKERWGEQRRRFATSLSALEETKAQEKAAKGGKAPRGDATTLAKIKELKAKRKAAETKHRRALRKLTVSYNSELRACTSRGTFLGSDQLGRQFYALASPPKSIQEESRWDNWSTFVACWGAKQAGLEPKWYGFGSPSELRNLAATLGATPPGPASTGVNDSLIKSLSNFAEFLEDRMGEQT